MSRIVTVDGPAGSGKSTLGARLAEVLRLPLVDTGLLYRAVTAVAARRGLRGSDETSLAALAAALDIDVSTDPRQSPPRVWVDGAELGVEIYSPALAPLLAAVSRSAGVRAALLQPQRRLAQPGGAVAVGRDCGTVVFPEAQLKLYLDAPEGIRLQRRARQLARSGGGGAVGAPALVAEVSQRDRSDASRSQAPMRPAAGAVVIDTAAVGVEETVERALDLCQRAGLMPR